MTKPNNTCYTCCGVGTMQRTRTVQDFVMSFTLGSALGVGFLPQYKTEYYTETCITCRGSGKR